MGRGRVRTQVDGRAGCNGGGGGRSGGCWWTVRTVGGALPAARLAAGQFSGRIRHRRPPGESAAQHRGAGAGAAGVWERGGGARRAQPLVEAVARPHCLVVALLDAHAPPGLRRPRQTRSPPTRRGGRSHAGAGAWAGAGTAIPSSRSCPPQGGGRAWERAGAANPRCPLPPERGYPPLPARGRDGFATPPPTPSGGADDRQATPARSAAHCGGGRSGQDEHALSRGGKGDGGGGGGGGARRRRAH